MQSTEGIVSDNVQVFEKIIHVATIQVKKILQRKNRWYIKQTVKWHEDVLKTLHTGKIEHEVTDRIVEYRIDKGKN